MLPASVLRSRLMRWRRLLTAGNPQIGESYRWPASCTHSPPTVRGLPPSLMPLRHAPGRWRRSIGTLRRGSKRQWAQSGRSSPMSDSDLSVQRAREAMPQVSVTINGRQFRVACEEGEEPRLMRLAEDLDQRISRLRERFGEIGDTRLTVMAALTLADELSDTRERLQRVETELAKLQEAAVASAERTQTTHTAIVAALNAAAERIESITKRLNETVTRREIPMG